MIVAAGERLVRMPEVIERTSLSRSSIYRRMHRGEFPQLVQIGANSVAWRASEIARWLAAPLDWQPLPLGAEGAQAMPELAVPAVMAKGRATVGQHHHGADPRTDGIATAIRSRGFAASHIAGLCEMMVAALVTDTDTQHLGQAIEGLGMLAGHLSSDLFALADRVA